MYHMIENEFHLHMNEIISFLHESMDTKTHFEKEAHANFQMDYFFLSHFKPLVNYFFVYYGLQVPILALFRTLPEVLYNIS